MINLKGTEKQIKRAENIRNKQIEEYYTNNTFYSDDTEAFSKYVDEGLELMKNKIENATFYFFNDGLSKNKIVARDIHEEYIRQEIEKLAYSKEIREKLYLLNTLRLRYDLNVTNSEVLDKFNDVCNEIEEMIINGASGKDILKNVYDNLDKFEKSSVEYAAYMYMLDIAWDIRDEEKGRR